MRESLSHVKGSSPPRSRGQGGSYQTGFRRHRTRICGGLAPRCKDTRMRSLIDRINGFLSMLCAWGMLILTLLLVFDFVSRGAPSFFAWLASKPGLGWIAFMGELPFLQPIHVISDISVIVMIMGVYLGLGYCEQRGEHVRLELLANALPPRGRFALNLFSLFMQIGIVGVMTYSMYRNTLNSIRTEEAAPGVVPFIIWPAKVVVCVGLIFYLLQILVTLWDTLSPRTPAPASPEEASAGARKAPQEPDPALASWQG